MKRSSLTKSRRGQSSIEFAISLFFFLAILFPTLDMMKIFYTWLSVHYAVHQGTRWGLLGQTFDVNGDGVVDETDDRVTAIKEYTSRSAKSLGVQLEQSEVFVSSRDQNGVTTSNDAGGPGDFLQVRGEEMVVLSPLTGILAKLAGAAGRDFPDHYNVTVTAVAKNELFG